MWIAILGYVASASVLTTFCMSTMMPLRIAGIVSNVLFSAFGALAHIYPIMILHLILLPVNTIRLVQIHRLVRGMESAQSEELTIETLLPFMSRSEYPTGHVLVRRGERADRMYYLVTGQVEVKEIGKILGPGNVLGEIGVFARDQKRMATVECISDCEILELTAAKAKEIYYQNPAFAYAVLQVIIARLMEDITLSQPNSAHPPSNEPPAAPVALAGKPGFDLAS
jgi:CRP/FNR family cyclic AMP-dependent transcriptional regulator